MKTRKKKETNVGVMLFKEKDGKRDVEMKDIYLYECVRVIQREGVRERIFLGGGLYRSYVYILYTYM